MAHGYKSGGRRAGTPNKVTSDCRRVIASLLDDNVHKLAEWLNAVAEGVRKVDPETGLKTDEYVVKPNPAKAFDMYQSIMEFHIPKTARIQVATLLPDTHQTEEISLFFKEIVQGIREERQARAYGEANDSA